MIQYNQGKVLGLLSSADLAIEIKNEVNQFIGLEEAFAKHSVRSINWGQSSTKMPKTGCRELISHPRKIVMVLYNFL